MPALNRVGVAWVNQPSLIMLYVSITLSMSSLWMPTATRINICWGRSAIWPSIFKRYERSRVLNPKKS